jgi:hypothetical protein
MSIRPLEAICTQSISGRCFDSRVKEVVPSFSALLAGTIGYECADGEPFDVASSEGRIMQLSGTAAVQTNELLHVSILLSSYSHTAVIRV